MIPNLDKLKVYAYRFDGYWRNVKKGIREYYRINMDILKRKSVMNCSTRTARCTRS